ncbi:MAG: UvrD-helicase domain-containing protein [Dehalococcoidales bacterium]|nr:UvrD-helicase domain-containing protein [Dehalococcoidales bacterium]
MNLLMDILAELNPAQQEAVQAIKGPVLILAGPGSGKTRVITQRVAYLLKVVKVNPRRIIAVTFTNKAAKEMTERLDKLVPGSIKQLTIGTFHAICARILRIDGKAINIAPEFVIYDDDDQTAIVKRCLLELNLDPKQHAPQAIITAISKAKSKLISPADYAKRGRSYFEEVVARVYERYEQVLAESKALDFDDLLMKTVLLFRRHPEVLERYQDRYIHVMVDEFQDTNLVQYELIKQIGEKYRNICVVGDPDQSIYSWRSADLRNILSFEHDYPDAKVILLEQNYRSTKIILETASNVISTNQKRKAKRLWTENAEGERVALVEAYTEQEEAQFVVREIEKLVAKGDFRPGDCAVMYRTNAQSRVLEEAFIRYGTPYRLVAGTRFYERREVKDIIAYFRLIQNPQDSVSLQRIINVPGRGIGQQTVAKLSGWAKSMGVPSYDAMRLIVEAKQNKDTAQLPFDARSADTLARFSVMIADFVEKSQTMDIVELFNTVTGNSGYKQYLENDPDKDERWENIMELRTVAQQYRELPPRESLTAFLESVALVSDVDGYDEKLDRVTLITLHQAKGLEFPVVFIVGVEEKLLPHIRSMDDPDQLEEERRLCYVGITRAKNRLYLIHAFRRTFMGTNTVNPPSRFLDDIPRHLVTTPGWQGEETKVSDAVFSWNRVRIETPTDKSIVNNGTPAVDLKAGDRVRHSQFGEGVVVNSKKVREDSEVTVAFSGQGIKKLLQSLAKLAKI